MNIYYFANEYVLPFLRFIIVVAGMSCKPKIRNYHSIHD